MTWTLFVYMQKVTLAEPPRLHDLLVGDVSALTHLCAVLVPLTWLVGRPYHSCCQPSSQYRYTLPCLSAHLSPEPCLHTCHDCLICHAVHAQHQGACAGALHHCVSCCNLGLGCHKGGGCWVGSCLMLLGHVTTCQHQRGPCAGIWDESCALHRGPCSCCGNVQLNQHGAWECCRHG